MAASAREKDFVHIVTRSLAKTTGTAPEVTAPEVTVPEVTVPEVTVPEVMVCNIATFERQYDTVDVKEKWR